ncbi:MAG: undecaprenyl-diphosphate phosphatase [Candidatus Dojkabacteria bacterium]|nr:MAG: undecaprenyl-diphosphate phosphatase [Candidatus Dojkabacteria bacterium]
MIGMYLLLNLIQAITEFLPISSSGHLVLFGELYGLSEEGIESFLHLPTTLAILVVFFPTLLHILKSPKLWGILLAAMVPAGLVGLLLSNAIDLVLYSPIVVAVNQLFWGSMLWYNAVNYHTHKGEKPKRWQELTLRQAFTIGLLQILALIPGTSRSGITTLAGMWNTLTPQQSATFSFISGFPLILAASLLGLKKVLSNGELTAYVETIPLLIGMLLSFIVGIICIRLFISRHTLLVMKISGIYRIILGTLILIWLI